MKVSQELINEQNQYIEKISKLIDKKTYYIATMGCQLNENESEKLAGMIVNMGYEKTDSMDTADLIVFNTCCVRENAEEKVVGQLGYLKNLKRSKPDIMIAVGGCMTQEGHMVEKLNKTYGQHVDVIFGTHNLYRFPELLYEAMINNERKVEIFNIDGDIVEGLPIKRDDSIKASVTIMYGCNNFCSYCIVPYVRGRERSRNYETIIEEVKGLAQEGYKEIMLLGQNVNSYGNDFIDKKYTFAELLKAICKIDGIERIRFMSPHPKDFSDELIDVIASEKKVCKAIHLPLQSGSTAVLEKMNRKYTKESYLALVDKIRSKVKGATFSTDIIVGFPGETEEDFLDTVDVVKKVRYDSAYTFVYSIREGTVAAKMENQIPEDIKSRRIGELIKVVNEILEENCEKLVGRKEKIIVEGESKNNPEVLTGRTDGNKVVNFVGDKTLIGKMIEVEIVEQRKWYLEGRVL